MRLVVTFSWDGLVARESYELEECIEQRFAVNRALQEWEFDLIDNGAPSECTCCVEWSRAGIRMIRKEVCD